MVFWIFPWQIKDTKKENKKLSKGSNIPLTLTHTVHTFCFFLYCSRIYRGHSVSPNIILPPQQLQLVVCEIVIFKKRTYFKKVLVFHADRHMKMNISARRALIHTHPAALYETNRFFITYVTSRQKHFCCFDRRESSRDTRSQSENWISPDVMLVSNCLLMFPCPRPSVAYWADSTYLV